MNLARSDSGERDVRSLHRRLLDAWNARDVAAMAALFADEGNLVGFDGSQMTAREIKKTIGDIFANHQTAAYIGIIRDVRFPTPEVAILRAVVGMVPPGQSDVNPAVNAVQTLVAARRDGVWRIELFQNTPAQFHGRPELAQQLTDELRRLLQK